ncbi:MAG: hypothetical protein SVV80_13720 [Planctomycetota bacterium]|nr:hypothetical protein [Planctomycetota bacterium]
MNGRGKSDSPIVPKKPANKGDTQRLEATHPERASAEQAERRGPAKGNSLRQNQPVGHSAAPGWQNALERIRQVACKDRQQRFTALWHHVYNVDRLRAEYFDLMKQAAPGVDGQT